MKKLAAVCIIRRDDDRYLCVWNKRYGGWSFPGGKVEEGETPIQAAARELMEETGSSINNMAPFEQVFEGEHGIEVEGSRGSYVHIFSLPAPARWLIGYPSEKEIGCPVTWLTRKEFMRYSPFASFYETVFAKLDADGVL